MHHHAGGIQSGFCLDNGARFLRQFFACADQIATDDDHAAIVYLHRDCTSPQPVADADGMAGDKGAKTAQFHADARGNVLASKSDLHAASGARFNSPSESLTFSTAFSSASMYASSPSR